MIERKRCQVCIIDARSKGAIVSWPESSLVGGAKKTTMFPHAHGYIPKNFDSIPRPGYPEYHDHA